MTAIKAKNWCSIKRNNYFAKAIEKFHTKKLPSKAFWFWTLTSCFSEIQNNTWQDKVLYFDIFLLKLKVIFSDKNLKSTHGRDKYLWRHIFLFETRLSHPVYNSSIALHFHRCFLQPWMCVCTLKMHHHHIGKVVLLDQCLFQMLLLNHIAS
jgi:hypothetical protein